MKGIVEASTCFSQAKFRYVSSQIILCSYYQSFLTIASYFLKLN